MEITVDDLSSPEIAAFLETHMADMRRVSPPESTHALDLDALRGKDILFWSMRDGDALLACGALKLLGENRGEIKSMRVSGARRGAGLGNLMLGHIMDYARSVDINELLLETGSMDFFAPARRLYEKHGFEYCDPFGSYIEDHYSVFMSKTLLT